MFNQYYRLPELVEVTQDAQFTISLSEDVSDYTLMQALRAPLLELVVAKMMPNVASNAEPKAPAKSHSACQASCELLVRLQAGFQLSMFDCKPAAPDSFSNIDESSAESTAENAYSNKADRSGSGLTRTLGQGARLYAAGGHKPTKLIETLRRGLRFSVSFAKSGPLVLNLEGTGHAGAGHAGAGGFELVALEADLRLSEDPAVLQNAKSVLSRAPEYDASAAALALLITELEQARRELHEYLSGADKHPGLASEALRLEPMLAQRRQWLLRQYAQSQERVQLSYSANERLTDTEQLQRLIKCYELLCPPDINAMVHSIAEEN
ncbi:hypothetical protein KJI95_13940 [Shewanella sp. JM162201]|uniref:Uncharacterized protein n=1 Tax=Shewanella jiangmenensis TaxID=2837387 RepID=A0ABS5V583_9GAMM|nr:hypothetical protein [Shewanella jiangmenensis]MBT1445619.1 hypothetical protein [Shewanella jiangmenensis]